MPFQKCKAALDSVEFVDKMSAVGLGSNFADIITQMAQDVSFLGSSALIIEYIRVIMNLNYLLSKSKIKKLLLELTYVQISIFFLIFFISDVR